IRYGASGLSRPSRFNPSEETVIHPLSSRALRRSRSSGQVPRGICSSRTLASSVLVALGATMQPVSDGTIVGLSVVPRVGRADVVVRVEGLVTFKHFTLSNPDRIVVDLADATLGLPGGDAYDGATRGGITQIRYSQFTRSVVRVVLTLDGVH